MKQTSLFCAYCRKIDGNNGSITVNDIKSITKAMKTTNLVLFFSLMI